MKNTYLLPTDKPSRLFWNFNKLSLGVFNNVRLGELVSGRNIYITSDEKPKPGDYAIATLNGNSEIVQLNQSTCIFYNSKIILTTDQDLIKDGVEEIDDAFLEWFVKNPSCERVEIESFVNGSVERFYEIIIPKKESKQENRKVCKCKRAYENILSGICSLCWNELYPNEKDEIKDEDLLESKQETVEEAAKSNYENKTSKLPVPTLHWINSEFLQIQNFKEGAKWQQERSYSEEDMIQFSAIAYLAMIDPTNNKSFEELLQIWFEQFKKKTL